MTIKHQTTKDAERQRNRQGRIGADDNVTLDGSTGSYNVDKIRRKGSRSRRAFGHRFKQVIQGGHRMTTNSADRGWSHAKMMKSSRRRQYSMEVLESDVFGVGGGQASRPHGLQSRAEDRVADLRSPTTYPRGSTAIAAMSPEYNDLGTNDTRGPGQMATDRVRGESSEPDNNSQLSEMAVLILPRTLVAAVLGVNTIYEDVLLHC